MYKVFVNDCLIILTDNKKISTNLEVINFENCNFVELVYEFLHIKKKGKCLLCNDLGTDWEFFKSHFKIQKAAGGKVLNANEEVLFIYRLNKWDLPKGKIEKNESIEHCAIREVEEECGISNLTITDALPTTYHIFKRNGKLIFKITYWFLMTTSYKGKLIPQLEEGIELVVFKNEKEQAEALKNTYENIKVLF